MNSNGWSPKEPILKASHLKISRKKYNSQSESFFSDPQNRQRYDSSLFIMKMDLLTKKLNKKPPSQPLTYSRYSNLKSTKCPELIRSVTPQESSIVELKSKKETLEAYHENQLDKIEQEALFYEERCKEVRQYSQDHTTMISNDIQQLYRILREVGERSIFISPVRKQYRFFSDLFHTPKKETESLLPKKINTRKKTLSSACKEPSLLLSFKKNMEDDDGYVTLKYSEESFNREPNDTLIEGWQSFQKDKSRVRKRIEAKEVKQSCIIPQQITEEYFQTIKDTILDHLNTQKQQNAKTFKESQQICDKLQNLLNQIVEQIAEEKVEREHEWRTISKSQDQEIMYLSYNIAQLKKEDYQYEDQIDEKISQIQAEFMDQLTFERSERKLQEKLMIKMMIDVVQCFK